MSSEVVEAVPDDVLLSIISEVEAGRGRIKHIAPVAKAVFGERGKVDTFLEHQAEAMKILLKLQAGQAELKAGQEALRQEMNEGQEALRQEMNEGQEALRQEMKQGFATMEQTLVKHLDVYTGKILNGVAAQLERHGVPISEDERRGYRD